jgi:4-amino-4-deoxy-L-arabinose transferase-like glycosyltransferase
VARSLVARRGAEAGALAAILALASVLRFTRLADRGFIYWDEGKFALEGIRLQSALRLLSGAHVDLLAGKAVGTAKPMHALLIALAYGLMGIHDYASLYVNAFSGVVCVALTYLIGRLLVGPASGLIAAALLAVSEYEVIYARSALSESDATAFLLAGIAVWLYASRPDGNILWRRSLLGPGLAGLLFGIGFTTNYRLIVYIAVAIVIDVAQAHRAVGWKPSIARMAGWAVGVVIAPLLWQIAGSVGQAHGLVLYRGEIVRDSLPYWREVVYQLHQGKQSILHFNPLIYLQWWVLRQGWPASLLLLAALLRALWVRTSPWLIPAAFVLAPYAVYVFAPFVVPRNLVPALPFASILVASLLVDVSSRAWSYGRALGAVLVLLLLGLGAYASWPLTAVRSGFALAARWVNVHDRGRALTSSEIMVYYLRGAGPTCDAPAMPYSSGDLRAFIREGYHYAILDRHNNSNLTVIVRRVEPRVARFPTLGNVHLGESLISSENSNPPAGDTRTEYVNVYYLYPGRLPPGRPGQPAPCRRDRVT